MVPGGLVEAEPRAADPSVGDCERALAELAGRRRVQPCLDPGVHLVEDMGGDEGTDREEGDGEYEVAPLTGRDPQQHHEHGEDEHGEADVVLQPDHGHGERPGQPDREKGSGVDDQAIPDPGGRDGAQLLVLREVRGEEDAQQDLGDLDGTGTGSGRGG